MAISLCLKIRLNYLLGLYECKRYIEEGKDSVLHRFCIHRAIRKRELSVTELEVEETVNCISRQFSAINISSYFHHCLLYSVNFGQQRCAQHSDFVLNSFHGIWRKLPLMSCKILTLSFLLSSFFHPTIRFSPGLFLLTPYVLDSNSGKKIKRGKKIKNVLEI